MVFYPPSWSAKLPSIPDSVPLWEFLADERHGRVSHSRSRDPLTCGLSGASYSSGEVVKRTQHLSRALQRELQWDVTKSSELERVVCMFTFNTVGT